MREEFDHQRLPTYEDMSPEEQREVDNDMAEVAMRNGAATLIENGQSLRAYRCWKDDIEPLLPKTMRDAA
jgi:hypothetical protein